VPGRAIAYGSLDELLPERYAARTEEALLLWNYVPIRLSYRYDLSIALQDLLPTLENLATRVDGSDEVVFASNTFSARWEVTWSRGRVNVRSEWRSVAGNYEKLLNSRPEIEMPTVSFLGEWRLLLEQVETDVTPFRESLTDAHFLDRLVRLARRLPRQSHLYGEPAGPEVI